MKTGKHFIQVFIEGEQDLPKEEGEYHVKHTDSFRLTTMVFKSDHPTYIKNWLFDDRVDWYLQPLPEQTVTKNECWDEAKRIVQFMPNEGYTLTKEMAVNYMMVFAKWMRDKLQQPDREQLREEHVNNLTNVIKEITEEYFHDDDVSGGYIESPGKNWITIIDLVIEYLNSHQ